VFVLPALYSGQCALLLTVAFSCSPNRYVSSS